MSDRKFSIVAVSPSVFKELFQHGEKYFSIKNGIPKDARLLEMQYSFQEGVWLLKFASDSFDEVHIGACPPRITPIIEIANLNEVKNKKEN